MNIETRNFDINDIEIRSNEDSTPKARGYAAVFNSESCNLGGFTEIIEQGAFKRSLAQASSGQLNIFALWSHDSSQPLGSTKSGKLTLSEDERGLAFEMDVSRMSVAQVSALHDGDLRMSFAFCARDERWTEAADGTVTRTLADVDLSEVSFVINPAYPATEAALRSLDLWKAEQREIDRVDTFEQLKKVMFLQASLRIRD